ncbi:hypothetical protein PsorP6_009379 [Peronosclerospora sorghi]|uniref:Uncharacterized protein n=1 Tax=Peronosclerospora sorghi TaxID=230839 RepID=A0ACC0VXJ9_9STRA|nr:hypothetical protein PsorP6_009379 [Peronosclerospora sorghi]
MRNTDWKAEYLKAVAPVEKVNAFAPSPASHQKNTTHADPVIAFLDLLLTQEGGEWWEKIRHHAQSVAKKNDGQTIHALTGEDKKQLILLKRRLASIATDWLVAFPELTAPVRSSSVTVRVLQLQVVCRMLCYGKLTSMERKQKRQLKKEMRGILDRVALLLDAANPPSLADEDADERSPFQQFLQHQLGPRFQLLLPKLMQYLFRMYELQDKEEDNRAGEDKKRAINAMLPVPVLTVPQSSSEVASSADDDNGSILSALRKERPTKSARPEANELFKQVQVSCHLQQKKRHRKLQQVSKHRSSKKKSRTSQSSAQGDATSTSNAAATHETKAPVALTTRLPDKSKLWRPTTSPTTSHMKLSERFHSAGSQTTTSSLTGNATHQHGMSGKPKTPLQPRPGERRSVTSSSIIRGTPDRPKRLAARGTRTILVEASPPVRKTNVAGASAPRLLQRKLGRPGTQPPRLFN